MDYMKKLSNLAKKIEKEISVEMEIVSYSGGVPGITTIDKIPFDRYDEIKGKLTKLFGEPENVAIWHFDQTKNVPPIKWKLAPKMEINELDHVHLVSMMQWKSKRYLIVSGM